MAKINNILRRCKIAQLHLTESVQTCLKQLLNQQFTFIVPFLYKTLNYIANTPTKTYNCPSFPGTFTSEVKSFNKLKVSHFSAINHTKPLVFFFIIKKIC